MRHIQQRSCARRFCREAADRLALKCFVWSVQAVRHQVSLSCPARLIRAEARLRAWREQRVSVEEPFLCCVFSCFALYSSSLIATRLPNTFLLSPSPAPRWNSNINGRFRFQRIVWLNGRDGGLFFFLSPFLFCCHLSLIWFGCCVLTYSPRCPATLIPLCLQLPL